MRLTDLESRLQHNANALASEHQQLAEALRTIQHAMREAHPPAHHRALALQADACAATIDVINTLAARYRRNL